MRSVTALPIVVIAVAACATSPVAAPLSNPSPLPTSTAPAVTTAATPVPSRQAPATPSATRSQTTVATDEIRWDRVRSIVLADGDHGGGTVAIAGFEDGYVVSDGTSSLRFSADGRAWTRVPLRADAGAALSVDTLAADGTHVIAAGSYTPCRPAAWRADPLHECRARPASWTSSDGLSWTPSARWTGPVGPSGKDGSWFSTVWSLPDGGWEAAQLFGEDDDSDSLDPTGPALWHSADGRHWTLSLATPPSTGTDCYAYAWSFRAQADAAGRRLALVTCEDEDASDDEQVGTDLLMTSADGQSYQVATTFPRGAREAVSAMLAAGDGRGAPWVVGGSAWSAITEAPRVWTSSDLDTWTTVELPTPPGVADARVSTVARGTHGYLAVGGRQEGDGSAGLAWLSDDGVVWRLADAAAPPALARGMAVTGPAGYLVVGLSLKRDSSETLEVWRASSTS